MLTAEQILNTRDPIAVFGSDTAAGFKKLVKLWHPDINHGRDARAVYEKLVRLRDLAEGKTTEVIKLVGGKLEFKHTEIVLTSKEPDCLATAQLIKRMRTVPDVKKWLPEVDDFSDATITFLRPADSVPLNTVFHAYKGQVHQRHVAWIVSRLYELTMLNVKFASGVNAGLLLESLVVLVADHGVIPMDWRFATLNGKKLTRVPGQLVPFVPTSKLAHPSLDLSSINALAIKLLGDPSGIGNMLRLRAKEHPTDLNPVFLDWFLRAPGEGVDPVAYYKKYRELLEKTWGKPKYFKLELP